MIFVKGFYQGVEFEQGNPSDTFLLILTDGTNELAAEINEESFHELKAMSQNDPQLPAEPMMVDGGPMEVPLEREPEPFVPPEDPVPEMPSEPDDFDTPPEELFSHDVGVPGEVADAFGGDGGVESV